MEMLHFTLFTLTFLIYPDKTFTEPPARVSLRFVSGSGLMVEGNQYQLECEVQSVAPVQNLTVKWFRGKTLLYESTVSQFSVTGHSYEGVTVTDRYNITASRDDHGVQYKCEAELILRYQSEPISAILSRISNYGHPAMISGRVTGVLILFSLMDWLWMDFLNLHTIL